MARSLSGHLISGEMKTKKAKLSVKMNTDVAATAELKGQVRSLDGKTCQARFGLKNLTSG